MPTYPDERLAVYVDGQPHMFDPLAVSVAHASAWTHSDCYGVDYGLTEVDGWWAWWVTVSPEVTLRSQASREQTRSAESAFEVARTAAREWLALYAW